MPYIIGVVLAIAVSTYARMASFDRDRSFYPTVLAAIASYYVLFAAMGASIAIIGVETLIMTAFLAAAAVGARRNLWVIVVALVGHGVLDAFHGALVHNSGVPASWPAFCLAFDVTAGAVLAWLLAGNRSLTSSLVARRNPMP